MRAAERKGSGFTLIELLIVVAIIAILAAIAVPNFLEAQLRSKISRVKADMRTLATGIEAYAVDNQAYPWMSGIPAWHPNKQTNRDGIHFVTCLTTPIAYLTTVSYADPFVRDDHGPDGYLIPDPPNRPYSLGYVNIQLFQRTATGNNYDPYFSAWVLLSLGPDTEKGPDPYGLDLTWNYSDYAKQRAITRDNKVAWDYDSTNGTISGGDIIRWQ